jgi:hypothetical protein
MQTVLHRRFGASFDPSVAVVPTTRRETATHSLCIFTPAEDALLALGISHYGLDDWHLIQRLLLCAKTVDQVWECLFARSVA